MPFRVGPWSVQVVVMLSGFVRPPAARVDGQILLPCLARAVLLMKGLQCERSVPRCGRSLLELPGTFGIIERRAVLRCGTAGSRALVVCCGKRAEERYIARRGGRRDQIISRRFLKQRLLQRDDCFIRITGYKLRDAERRQILYCWC